jgi:phage virion morphogenesis protein
MNQIKLNNDVLTPALQALKNNLNDASPLMQQIAGDLADAVEENFANEGPGWPALAASTLKQRQSKGYTGKMLQRTGALASSVTTQYNALSATIGTNKIYARIQNLGGDIHQAPRSNLYKQLRYKKGDKKGQFKKGKGTNRELGGSTFKERNIHIPPRPFITPQQGHIDIIIQRIKDFVTSFK